MPRDMRSKRRKKKCKVHEKKAKVKYGKPFKGAHVALEVQASGIYRRCSHEDIPSKGITGYGTSKAELAEDLSAEMKEREAIARKEAERRKKMIAPMYNKGAYQYIGGVDEKILHDIGKKK